jgi:hypothetical protein
MPIELYNARKVGLCMDDKNVGYEENKIGEFVLCENYNAIKL